MRAVKNGTCKLSGYQRVCEQCISDERFRASIGVAECPLGRHKMGLGDLVGLFATPVARILKMGCIDPATNDLRPESKCAKRKRAINKLTQ